MGTQHGSRHRHFEPPHDMRPGAPETLEALDAARVTDIARWAWESNGRVFQVEMQRLGGLNDVVRGLVRPD